VDSLRTKSGDWFLVVDSNQPYVYNSSTGKVEESLDPHWGWISQIDPGMFICRGTRTIIPDNNLPQSAQYYGGSFLSDSGSGHLIMNIGPNSFASKDSATIVSVGAKELVVRTISDQAAIALKSKSDAVAE
jgi:hypothetical protein